FGAAAMLVAGVADASAQEARVWLTTADGAHKLERQPAASLAAARAPDATITIDPQARYQTMIGFGASFTDASAWVIRHDLTPQSAHALMRELFSREGEGLGLSFTRLTIGASDFSPTHYSYDDVPEGQRDPELARFSIAPVQADLAPLVREA